MEAHDALLFSIPKSKVIEWSVIIKEEMERPIDFSHCTLVRHELSIPCEIDVGSNYRDLKKFKDMPVPPKIVKPEPTCITERFAV